jgi:hypothetical protein
MPHTVSLATRGREKSGFTRMVRNHAVVPAVRCAIRSARKFRVGHRLAGTIRRSAR